MGEKSGRSASPGSNFRAAFMHRRKPACNRATISRLLSQNGWAPGMLSEKTGLSLATILSVVNGDPTRCWIVDRIAKAFSVDPAVLTFDPMRTAENMLEIYARAQRDAVHEATSKGLLLSEGVRFEIMGEEWDIPFAGTFQGIGEVNSFFGKFFSIFDKRGEAPPRVIEKLHGGDKVAVKIEEITQASGKPTISAILDLTFHFQSQQLVRVVDTYDTHLMVKYLGLEPPAPKSEMGWRQARELLRELCRGGKTFTSFRALAAQLGCRSKATIHKAIHGPPADEMLAAWLATKRGRPKSQSLDGFITDNTAERREPDPAEEAVRREDEYEAAKHTIINAAGPKFRGDFNGLAPDRQRETVAWLRGLTSEEREMFLKDPDAYDRILGRRP